ncbi:GNAT family N-acetyltransferase [Neisseriaceae bacterium JH1-16]|nr:GNAT family N-acetyltransferase [Neisseriaceae bacterium JH1-16]
MPRRGWRTATTCRPIRNGSRVGHDDATETGPRRRGRRAVGDRLGGEAPLGLCGRSDGRLAGSADDHPGRLTCQTIWVAERDGVALGFAVLARENGTLALSDLWVTPAAMRQGIGRLLLRQVQAEVARAGEAGLSIDADPQAEAFYLRCGAERRGQLPAPIPGQPERVRPQLWLAARPAG